MKKTAGLILAFFLTFAMGFGFHSLISPSPSEAPLKRVTGIGGIFFKCKDPGKLRAWYQKHLGLNTNSYGSVFEWRQGGDTTKKGFTQWSPFRETTKYFEPSQKDFMINYRVADMDRLLLEFKKENVTVLDTVEKADYGKFVHILDLEGNKIELWEPNDLEFEKLGFQMGAKTTK
jgi:predicted enzyme related to lactoylglutathione lyase